MNQSISDVSGDSVVEQFVPRRVFIVPYRDRMQQKFFFSRQMSFLLEGETDYEIYFSHQCDARGFNRGATKNVGFLAIKNKYPNHYKDITFIFNDLDTMPFHKLFDYYTTHGVVKHYYGFNYALGGIVAITGRDFERINGFPNFWGWGMEDNVLQKRCEMYGVQIDRSHFYTIGSPYILQLFEGITRIVNRKDPWRATYDDGHNGLSTTHSIELSIDEVSLNPLDNIYTVDNDRIYYINILTFLTSIPFEQDEYINYDLRSPRRKIINPDKLPSRPNGHNGLLINNWTNEPFCKNQIDPEEEKIVRLNTPTVPPRVQQLRPLDGTRGHPNPQVYTPTSRGTSPKYPPNPYPRPVNNRPQATQGKQVNQGRQVKPRPINPYAPDYARRNGIKPKATTSARVHLGGVY